VNHGLNLPLSSTHRNLNQITPDLNQGSPPTQRGSVGSTRRGSVGSTQIGSGVSTQRGSVESGDTIWIGDGGGNNGEQGGDRHASASAMASRDGNGGEGKKA
jgi:hypothetical protein